MLQGLGTLITIAVFVFLLFALFGYNFKGDIVQSNLAAPVRKAQVAHMPVAMFTGSSLLSVHPRPPYNEPNSGNYLWAGSGGSSMFIPPAGVPLYTPHQMKQLFSKLNTLWIGDSNSRQAMQTMHSWMVAPNPEDVSSAQLNQHINLNKGGQDQECVNRDLGNDTILGKHSKHRHSFFCWDLFAATGNVNNNSSSSKADSNDKDDSNHSKPAELPLLPPQQGKFDMYYKACATSRAQPIIGEPVSRVVSCLAFRHGPEMNGNCIEDMDVELLRFLLEKPDAYGNSCLNEPFRIMSGIRSDRFVDTLDVCDEFSQGPEGMVNPHAKLEFALQLTLEHASKCSPLILESQHTYAAASTRFKTTPLRFVDGQGMMLHIDPADGRKQKGKLKKNNCSDRQWEKSNLKLAMCKTALERVLYHTAEGRVCVARS